MTPEQKRIAIAEAEGFVPMYAPGEFKSQVWHIPGGSFDRLTDCRTFESLPDYLNDLNAMHRAEKVLNARGLWHGFNGYVNTLCGVIDNADTTHATAAQRAEAFLLVSQP